MIVYKEKERLRAEVFKNLGYFFASIFGLIVIRIVVYGDHLSNYCNLQGFASIILLFLADLMINIASTIYQDLDYKTYKNDKMSKGEQK